SLTGSLRHARAALATGTGCYAALLTPQGRMLSDMRVMELGDRGLLDVPYDVTSQVASPLRNFLFGEAPGVKDVTAAMSHITVLGRESASVIGTEPIRSYASRRVETAGVETIAVGTDDFGVRAIA